MDREVLIVGAGPTGLTAAAELLRRGVPTRLVDRAEHESPHAKAVVLWPRALDVFARLGAEARIRELAVPITAANYHTGARRVARINYRSMPGSRFATPLSLPQNLTEAVLREVLAELGGEIEFGERLEGLEQTPDAVLSRLTGGVRRSSWVIGADGAHSAVRTAVGARFEGSTYGQSFVLVDGYWDTPLEHLESHYFMTPAGVLVVVGLPGGVVRVFGGVPAGTPAELSSDQIVELVQELAAARCPVPLRLQSAVGSGLFQVHRRMADRLRVGRVLLAGDAAHVHSPAGGQGLNTSIQDTHELAWRLAGVVQGRLDPRELDLWERERVHVAHQVLLDTDRQTRLWTARGARARARDGLLRAAGTTGLLDRMLPLRQAQLTVDYPAAVGRGPLPAGRRLPDLPLAGGGRLHDLLRPGRHLLLVHGSGPGLLDEPWLRRFRAEPVTSGAPDTGAGPVPVDPEGGPLVLRLDGGDAALLRALGLSRPGLLLIRPDGVVAVGGGFHEPDLPGRVEAALPLPLPAVLQR